MPFTTCIIIVILIILNIKKKNRIMQGILIGFLSASFTIIIMGIIININVKFESILILNVTFSNLVRNIINELLKIFQNVGIITAILSTIFLIATNTVYEIKQRKLK